MIGTIDFKPGVNVDCIKAEAALAIIVAANVNQLPNTTVTSGCDGIHMQGSLHPRGLAVDLRIHGNPDPARWKVAIKEALGPAYDVILETDHIHIEFDPK